MGVNAPLVAVTSAPVSAEQLATWNAEALALFGSWSNTGTPRVELCMLDVSEPGEYWDLGINPRDVSEAGGAAIDVDLCGERYYGPGYERGDCKHIIAVAEWVERAIAPALLLYGEDTGERLERFGATERAALLEHFNGPDGDAYYRGR
jgi:hypothetical protein